MSKRSGEIMLSSEAPKALDIEEKIIGSLILSPEWMHEVKGILIPECFYEEKYKIIFEKMLLWESKGYLLDAIFIRQKLWDEGYKPSMNPADDINRIVFSAYEFSQLYRNTFLNTKELIQASFIVVEKYMRREAEKAAYLLIKYCRDESEFFLDQLSEHNKLITNISCTVDKRSDYAPSKWIKEALEHIHKGMTMEGINGIPTGIKKLDRILGGLQRGNVITIAARPRIGKSALALFIAYMMAMVGIPVVYFTIEMTKKELAFRIFAIMTGVPYSDIQRGALTTQQWELINRISGDLSRIPLYLDDTSSLNTDKLRSKVYKYKRDHDVQCVIVDYLQKMKFHGKENLAEKLTNAVDEAKEQAKTFDIPYVLLSQVDRATEKGGVAKAPTIADLKGSGGIEEGSDVIICLHRPDEFEDSPVDAHGESLVGIMEMYIEKNKQGETGVIRIPFTKEVNQFENEEPDRPFAGFKNKAFY